MEAERLHDVLLTVLGDYERLNIPGLLTNLASHLETSASSPVPQQSQEFLGGLAALVSALEGCRSNGFAPSRQRILQSIGAASLTGRGLRAKVEEIIAANQLTPGMGVKQLRALGQESAELLGGLQKATSALLTFGVGKSDALGPDQCEIGAHLPESIVGGSVASFSTGLRELDKHLKPFAELVGSDAASWGVRSLSSGSLEVFALQALAVGGVVAQAIAWAQERYKVHLETKVLAAKLAETKTMKADTLERIVDDERESQALEIRAFASVLVAEHYKAEKRGKDGNEMTSLISVSLRYILDGVDHNADFEVTPPQLVQAPVDGQDEPTKASAIKAAAAVAFIQEKGAALGLLPPREAPVLALPPASDFEGEKHAEKAEKRK